MDIIIDKAMKSLPLSKEIVIFSTLLNKLKLCDREFNICISVRKCSDLPNFFTEDYYLSNGVKVIQLNSHILYPKLY